ncbi:MAG: ParB/RepB/Spo0J family partition protein, partial [Bdellovibrionales bacterium]|nr:ParB/RepB/Spo0J family partition protein [Bdellovibrionales bacterium]
MARKKVKFDINPLLSGPSLASRATGGNPYRELSLSEIDLDPDQPRRVFNEESIEELSQSIKEYGVLSPLIVQMTDGGTYKLVAGERRYRAAKKAGLKVVPALVAARDSEDSTLAKQLTENLQREDLSPMERALAIGQLKESYTWSIRDIAKRLGISKAMVQRSLEILSLPDDLQAALIAGASESKILILGSVADREFRKQLIKKLSQLTRAQLEAEIAK